jgi:excinuclease ABC subunit A
MDLVKCADYVIDLGLEGGEKGGHLICSGTPEHVAKNKESYTAGYLKDKLRSWHGN